MFRKWQHIPKRLAHLELGGDKLVGAGRRASLLVSWVGLRVDVFGVEPLSNIFIRNCPDPALDDQIKLVTVLYSLQVVGAASEVVDHLVCGERFNLHEVDKLLQYNILIEMVKNNGG